MNLTQKISQMTPKGADLAATDLIEVSTLEAGSYVTKSITGQELIDAIPLPPTGLTVGTTPIASGTIGRVLFQGTGNVVQQSSSLFWDSTNNRLGIGTSTPAHSLDVANGARIGSAGFGAGLVVTYDGTYINLVRQGVTTFIGSGALGNAGVGTFSNAPFTFFTNNAARTQITAGGNVLINTTTDAGFRLDVNGTARVRGTGTTSATTALTVQNSAGANLLKMVDDRSLLLGVFGSNNYLYFSDNGSGAAIKSDSYSMIFNTRSSGNVFNFTQGGNIDTATVIAQLSNLNYSVNTPTLIGAIGTTNTSAQLEVASTTKGFLPPRMTQTQRNAIASPAAGLVVYDNTDNKHYGYNGTTWNAFY